LRRLFGVVRPELLSAGVMGSRDVCKGGVRVLVATLVVVGSQAFLQGEAVSHRPHPAGALIVPHHQHRPARRAAGLARRQGFSGAGGLSATLPMDAMTRSEALNGFFAALVLSTTTAAAVTPTQGPSADRLGVIDDLLADCPSVRGKRCTAACD